MRDCEEHMFTLFNFILIKTNLRRKIKKEKKNWNKVSRLHELWNSKDRMIGQRTLITIHMFI